MHSNRSMENTDMAISKKLEFKTVLDTLEKIAELLNIN